jgi:iron complex outermembrane receptor protein
MYFSNTEDSIAPGTKLDGYELVNARLDWSGIMRSKLSAALFGRNLTDEDHFVGGMALGSSLGHNAAAVGEPRTYGAELTYRF